MLSGQVTEPGFLPPSQGRVERDTGRHQAQHSAASLRGGDRVSLMGRQGSGRLATGPAGPMPRARVSLAQRAGSREKQPGSDLRPGERVAADGDWGFSATVNRNVRVKPTSFSLGTTATEHDSCWALLPLLQPTLGYRDLPHARDLLQSVCCSIGTNIPQPHKNQASELRGALHKAAAAPSSSLFPSIWVGGL